MKLRSAGGSSARKGKIHGVLERSEDGEKQEDGEDGEEEEEGGEEDGEDWNKEAQREIHNQLKVPSQLRSAGGSANDQQSKKD